MRTATIAMAALAITATAAQANWTGCRVGLGGSVVVSTTEVTGGGTTIPVSGGIDSMGTQNVHGIILAGCDYQTGPVLFGAFGDFSLGENEWKASLNAPGLAASVTTGFENQWAVGVRAGYTVTPTTAIFLNGGWTGAKANDIVATVNGAEIARFALDNTKGWFVGGEMETHINPRLVFTLGYRYTRFDNETVSMAPLPASLTLDTDVHAVMATFSYRFGSMDPITPTK